MVVVFICIGMLIVINIVDVYFYLIWIGYMEFYMYFFFFGNKFLLVVSEWEIVVIDYQISLGDFMYGMYFR